MYDLAGQNLAGNNGVDDDSMLIRAAQHNPRAFAPLYERYVTRIYRYLRSRIPTDEEASDLTQQVFANALAALPTYRIGATPFAAWLFRIARNLATDAHRRRRVTIAWEFLPESLHPLYQPDAESAIRRQEEAAHLRSLLMQLPPEKREIVLLRFVGGLTASEIGTVVGKSEAAIHKQLARTLRSLKEHYHAD